MDQLITRLRFKKTNRVDWPGTKRAIRYALRKQFPDASDKAIEISADLDEKDLRNIVKREGVKVVFERWRVYWEGESAKDREKGPGK